MDIKLFQQKLNEICEIAEENGKQLSQQQIREHFDESNLNTSQLVKILQYLKLKGITIEGAEKAAGASVPDAASTRDAKQEEFPGIPYSSYNRGTGVSQGLYGEFFTGRT